MTILPQMVRGSRSFPISRVSDLGRSLTYSAKASYCPNGSRLSLPDMMPLAFCTTVHTAGRVAREPRHARHADRKRM